jgi:hypothetical protein
VEDIVAKDDSDLTINADGHNEFEEATARDNADLTINVTGENDFEEITGTDDASITIRGTSCQRKDVVNLGEGEEDTALTTERGRLAIDHVTVNLEGERAVVGSDQGDVFIDTSKVAKGDGNEYALIEAGGTMLARESVVDIAGAMVAQGEMTIEHSDVKVVAPDAKYGDDNSHRVWSATGVVLIDEENGEVREFEHNGKKAFYVDTDDGDDVDLEADGDPAYYRCKGDGDHDDHDDAAVRHLPRTGDVGGPLSPFSLALAGLAVTGAAVRRMRCDS